MPKHLFLMSGENKPFDPKNWVSRDYRLSLVCQHPPGPHRVGDITTYGNRRNGGPRLDHGSTI